MTSIATCYPSIEATDVSERGGVGAPLSFDPILPSTDRVETRLPDRCIHPMSSGKTSFPTGSKECVDNEHTEREFQVENCHIVKLCNGQEDMHNEDSYDRYQEPQQDSLHAELGEQQKCNHLCGQIDNQIEDCESPNIIYSLNSPCSDFGESSDHGRESYSCSTGSRDCVEKKMKHLSGLKRDEPSTHNKSHRSDALDANYIESTLSNSSLECDFNGEGFDGVLKCSQRIWDGNRHSSADVDNDQAVRSCSNHNTPVCSASCSQLCQHEWELIKITNKKRSGGTTYYKVQWQETWEPEHALSHATKLIDAYNNERWMGFPGKVELKEFQMGRRGIRKQKGWRAKKHRLQS